MRDDSVYLLFLFACRNSLRFAVRQRTPIFAAKSNQPSAVSTQPSAKNTYGNGRIRAQRKEELDFQVASSFTQNNLSIFRCPDVPMTRFSRVELNLRFHPRGFD